MIDGCNNYKGADESYCQEPHKHPTFFVPECGKPHYQRGVNHAEFVEKLHGIYGSTLSFQDLSTFARQGDLTPKGRVEKKRPEPHKQEAYPGHQKDGVMAMFDAIPDALSGDVDEHEVRD